MPFTIPMPKCLLVDALAAGYSRKSNDMSRLEGRLGGLSKMKVMASFGLRKVCR